MKRFEQDQEKSTQSPTSIDSSTASPSSNNPSSNNRASDAQSSDSQSSTKKQSSTSVPSNHPSDMLEAVRRRAYEIYEQRGMTGGSEEEDWLQAEAEILGDRRTQQAA